MQHSGATRTVNANPAEVWALVGNVSTVDGWHPDVASAELLSPKATGIGATRRCFFYDGTSVREDVVELDEGTRVRIRLSEFEMPMNRMEAEFTLVPSGQDQTQVTFTVFYEMKMSFLGRMMGTTVVRRRLATMASRVLAGLDHYLATGETIGENFDASVARSS
ncbi:MAG: SRPBCC family protein [bacterium]|nr:SRPBCC family protein [bacterium]